MFCYNCDTRNPNSARFCVTCGQALPERATAAAATPRPYAPSPTPTIAYAEAMPAAFGPALAPAGAGASIVQHIYINQGQAQPQAQIHVQQPSISLLVRAIWFLLVGLWLGQVWLIIAWLFNLTIIGLPLGIWMLNRLPQVMTLRPAPLRLSIGQQGASTTVRRDDGPGFAVRAIYFALVGWWVSLLWLQLAWVFAATLIGLPLAFLMFERTSIVTTLGD